MFVRLGILMGDQKRSWYGTVTEPQHVPSRRFFSRSGVVLDVVPIARYG
jgi:hypothetical protein